MQSTILLNVGGQHFRASKTTLTHVESYFSRLISNVWIEGVDNSTDADEDAFLSRSYGADDTALGKSDNTPEKIIFIDRDPTCFPSILSYLRSLKVYFTADIPDVYLHQLYDEADYYMLTELQELVNVELNRRTVEKTTREEFEKKDSNVESEVSEIFKVINPTELQDFFDRGYAFVSSFEGNDTAACTSNVRGCKIETEWRQGACTACGDTMVYEKFVKHSTTFRPTKIVVKRSRDNGGTIVSNSARVAFRSGGTGISSVSSATPVRQGERSGDNPGNLVLSPLGTVPLHGLRNTPGQFNLDTSF